MRKVRAFIIVDLNVSDNLTNKQIEKIIGVGKYQENNQKNKDFEVLDYIDVEIIERK